MTKNPISHLDFKMVDVDRGYLSKSELRLLRQTLIGDKSLAKVRDLFVFSCFTWLAYSDVRNFTGKNIVTDDKDSKWVSHKRQKTKVGAKVLLMPIPMEIVGRHWKSGLRKAIFPDIPSNTLLNHLLTKIMELCEIRKNAPSHMARHTFATTVTLSEGVSIESVSKMLGHKKIRTNQIYALITDQRIADEITLLMEKLDEVY